MKDFNELKSFLKHVDQVQCAAATHIERYCDAFFRRFRLAG